METMTCSWQIEKFHHLKDVMLLNMIAIPWENIVDFTPM
jgi:hypothetical protein